METQTNDIPEILNIEYHIRILLIRALNRCKHIKDAAGLLGISSRTLRRYMRDLEITQNRRKQYYIPQIGTVIQMRKAG